MKTLQTTQLSRCLQHDYFINVRIQADERTNNQSNVHTKLIESLKSGCGGGPASISWYDFVIKIEFELINVSACRDDHDLKFKPLNSIRFSSGYF